MKFKIGDKVKFKNFDENKDEKLGGTRKIKNIIFGSRGFAYILDGGIYAVTEEEIELVGLKEYKITFKNETSLIKEANCIKTTETEYILMLDDEKVAIIPKTEVLYIIKR